MSCSSGDWFGICLPYGIIIALILSLPGWFIASLISGLIYNTPQQTIVTFILSLIVSLVLYFGAGYSLDRFFRYTSKKIKTILLTVLAILLVIFTGFIISDKLEKIKGRYNKPVFTQSQIPENLDLIMSLERGSCFGTCPVYSIKIYKNGWGIYEGKKHVSTKGRRQFRLNDEKLNKLISEFEKINYFSLNDSYQNNNVTDHSTIITYINLNGKQKKITHYLGDETAPKELIELENKIDEIVGSDKWVK